MTAMVVVPPCHLTLPPVVDRACPCPLSLTELDLAPLLLDELEDLGLVLLEAIMLVATDTAHHSATA